MSRRKTVPISMALLTTLHTKDGDVVGLVRDGRPGVLMMMHDFTTGENWPRDRDRIWWGRLRDRL